MFFAISKVMLIIIAAIFCERFGDTTAEFNLHIVHFNDFHARFEETDVKGSTVVCKENCIGGFSRLYTAIYQELKRRPNSIVLNAGDNFQGTLWYTLFKWNVTQHFMNKIPTDAYALGNHEFDDHMAGVIPFIKTLEAPTVAANIDDSLEPEFQNTYKKSIIIKRDGKRIGIIGVSASATAKLSSADKLKFTDESESVNAEAERLVANENVDTIIILSHCGYSADLKIAKLASPKIGIVVGGHSHTFLFTGNDTPSKFDKPLGPYPTIVKNKNGHNVLVVQALAYAKYLGNITVNYNDEYHVVSWSGAPIYLNRNIPQDKTINKEIAVWKDAIDVIGKRIIGETYTFLNNEYCRSQECYLGNLLTDATVYAYKNKTEDTGRPYVLISAMNPGSIRTSIQKGNITYSALLDLYPFDTTIGVGELQGKYLLEALEVGASGFSNTRFFWKLNFLQTSGIRVVYNTTKPAGSRVKSVQVIRRLCSTPKYEDLDLNKMYRIIVNSFIRHGGDGFRAISNNIINYQTGPQDIDTFDKYIGHISPIQDLLDGRIQIVT